MKYVAQRSGTSIDIILRMANRKFRHTWRNRSRIIHHGHHGLEEANHSTEKLLSSFSSRLTSSVLAQTMSIVSMQHWSMVQNHRLISDVYSNPLRRNGAESSHGQLTLPLCAASGL